MGADPHYMALALEEARKASIEGEVPVGAVLVVGDEVASRGHNVKESSNDPTAHAEMIAIRAAASALGKWRLPGASLYVTMEPCPMCMGAIIEARIDRLIYGCRDPKAGACGSVVDLGAPGLFNHDVIIKGGMLEKESESLLKSFFVRLRRTKLSYKFKAF